MQNKLFDDLEKLPGIHLARGYSLKAEKNRVFSLYKEHEFVRKVDFKDAVARRLFIVEMVHDYGFPKYRIHKATGISRQTIDNNLGCYELYGKEGLIGGIASRMAIVIRLGREERGN